MKIAAILATKGADVETIWPDRRVREAVTLLARRNIGALVVVDETRTPVGIMSERDVVRAAATDEGILTRRVSDIMTRHPELWEAAKKGKPRVEIDRGPFDKLYSGLIDLVVAERGDQRGECALEVRRGDGRDHLSLLHFRQSRCGTAQPRNADETGDDPAGVCDGVTAGRR